MFNALYVDLNSFFASVEQQLDPALRGQPIGVLPVMAETTCCIAASYEAKRLGIKTGTTVAEARKRCRQIRFVQRSVCRNASQDRGHGGKLLPGVICAFHRRNGAGSDRAAHP